MELDFYKYQGTGNDFIMIDNRHNKFDKNDTKRVAALCNRRFGIGADGFILLESHDMLDFKMVYYNADGNESSMCGNGGRCIVAFAKYLGVIENETAFEAVDGLHKAIIKDDVVELQMQDVDVIEEFEDHIFLNTGSPHDIRMEDTLESLDVKTNGSKIRYSSLYGAAGSNVNFVKQLSEDEFAMRTYERGVEDETLSCGTGVTAVALAMYHSGRTMQSEVKLKTQGGNLKVTFNTYSSGYKDIWLIGRATQVFKGKISW